MVCEIYLPVKQSKNIKRVVALSVTPAVVKLKNKRVFHRWLTECWKRRDVTHTHCRKFSRDNKSLFDNHIERVNKFWGQNKEFQYSCRSWLYLYRARNKITQFLTPTHVQLRHRLKFIKNHIKTPTCFGLRPSSGSYNILAKVTII
jgi:hypothetical protein